VKPGMVFPLSGIYHVIINISIYNKQRLNSSPNGKAFTLAFCKIVCALVLTNYLTILHFIGIFLREKFKFFCLRFKRGSFSFIMIIFKGNLNNNTFFWL